MRFYGIILFARWLVERVPEINPFSTDRDGGLDRLDAESFVLTILSRIVDRRRRRRFAPSLTRSSTRTECCPSDQGRFLGAPDKKDIGGNAYEKVRGNIFGNARPGVFRTLARVSTTLAAKAYPGDRAVPG